MAAMSNRGSSCPFSNSEKTIIDSIKDGSVDKCPFHTHVPIKEPVSVLKAPALALDRGVTHITSMETGKLLEDIGGGDRIREFCTRFYARAFEDQTLKQFFFLDDGAEAHGKRLADWIIEKMHPHLKPWTMSGRLGERQPSHYKAWNSEKRHIKRQGDHFKLDDTRIWMRLHFWAVRECGLGPDIHLPFWQWYQEFIGHFVRVYERKAPAYVNESAKWSSKKRNTEKYLKDGKYMKDVILPREGY